MLKKALIAVCLGLIFGITVVAEPVALAKDAGSCGKDVNAGSWGNVSSEIDCPSQNGGDTSGSGGGGSDGKCHNSSGQEVECIYLDRYWTDEFNMWCRTYDLPLTDPRWEGRIDKNGNPKGGFLQCIQEGTAFGGHIFWVAELPIYPTNAYQIALSAVQSLQLHPPTVGVGAFVQFDYYEYGRTWWVGAPMWLWVDKADPLQWGNHTLNPAAGGLSLNVDIRATKVLYDPGDGSPEVICKNPGTPRYQYTDEPIRKPSPSDCEHRYKKTNTLGDINSHYTITATVVWDIHWTASDGDYGHFTMSINSTDNPTVHIGELRAVIVAPPDLPTPTGR